jgi:hypothetical protein
MLMSHNFSLFFFKYAVFCAVMPATLLALFCTLLQLEGGTLTDVNRWHIFVLDVTKSCKPIFKVTFIVAAISPRLPVGTSYSLYMPDLNWQLRQWRDCCHAKRTFCSFGTTKRGVHPLLLCRMQPYAAIPHHGIFSTLNWCISTHASASCMSVSR